MKYELEPSRECIIKKKDGTFDWYDPVYEVTEDDEGNLCIENWTLDHVYKIPLKDIEDYKVRFYDEDTLIKGIFADYLRCIELGYTYVELHEVDSELHSQIVELVPEVINDE